jgi:hypothetical protein
MQYKPPWRFPALLHGCPIIVVNADLKAMVVCVPAANGLAIAATPTMPAIVRRTTSRLPKGDEVGDLARQTIARVGEPPYISPPGQ